MRTIKLTIEYDGSGFVGWQTQPNGPSVQETLEKALGELTGETIKVVGAGRTDSGVHALGQVASFETSSGLDTKAFREGLNHLLPRQVAVVAAEELPSGFHALRDAKGKHYRYVIVRSQVRRPLWWGRAWRVKWRLDLDVMRAAAAVIEGRHDFKAFCAAKSDVKTFVREVQSIDITEDEQGLLYMDVRGKGFLRQMVRRIAGCLVDVSRGYRDLAWIQRLVDEGELSEAGPTAPAYGLYLVEVVY